MYPATLLRLFCLVVAANSFDSLVEAQVPSAVPPNGSEVTASVTEIKVWPAGSLENTRPVLPSNQVFHSVELKLLTSQPARETEGHLVEAGSTVEAFSSETLPPDLKGRKIAATLSLVGDTNGVRWMLKNFRPLP